MSAAGAYTASYLAQDNRNEARVSSAVLIAVAAFCLALRLYTKLTLVKHIGASDAVISLALVLGALLTATFWLECKYGMGKHVEAVPMENYETILKLLWCSILLYNLTMALVKISILLQYVKIFASTSIQKICWFLLWLVCLHGMVATLLAVFGCTPVDYFWTKRPGGKCLPTTNILFFTASFNIATDIALVVLPLWVIRTLRMPKKQKIYVSLIFLLGGFGCITSILRLHSLYESSVNLDFTWVESDTAVWSSAEFNVGIVCACLATLKPLVVKCFPKSLLGSSGVQTSADTELGEVNATGGARLESKSDFHAITISEQRNESTESVEKEITAYDLDSDDLYHSFMKDINTCAV